jgi:hypothetical protein
VNKPVSGFYIYDVPTNPDDPTCNSFRGRPLPYHEPDIIEKIAAGTAYGGHSESSAAAKDLARAILELRDRS